MPLVICDWMLALWKLACYIEVFPASVEISPSLPREDYMLLTSHFFSKKNTGCNLEVETTACFACHGTPITLTDSRRHDAAFGRLRNLASGYEYYLSPYSQNSLWFCSRCTYL